MLTYGRSKTEGSTTILRKFMNTLILKRTEFNKPAEIVSVTFKNTELGSASEMVSDQNLDVRVIEQNTFDDSEINQELVK
jgi:hypothetical protein